MINRFLAFFALLPLFITASSAQLKPFKLEPFYKKWEDGKLTWDDFQGKPMEISPQSSELIYYFFYKPEKIKTRDTTFYKLRAYAFIDRNQTWVHDTAKTETNLKGNQVLFNQIELHRRILENRLLMIEKVKDSPLVYNEAFRHIREANARILVETNVGRDTAQVNAWLAKTYHQLDSVDTPMPAFNLRNFGIGMHMGYKKALVNGKLANSFSNFSGMDFGLNVSYRELHLFLTADMGSGKTIGVYHGKNYWPSNLKVNLNQLSVALGYPVLNAAHWRLVPFAGPAWVHISPNVSADEMYEGQYIQDNSAVFGLQFDWKRRNLADLTLPKGGSLMDYGLRARFMYYPLEFSRNISGNAYTISLSLYLQNRYLKIKM